MALPPGASNAYVSENDKTNGFVEQPESALCIDLAFGRLRCYHVARLPGLTDHRQRV